MEEIKSTSVSAPQDERKPYEPPTAEIILLVPKEELAGWTFGTDESADNRWALNGWGYSAMGHDPASGTYGTVTPKDWTLPTE